MWKIILHEPMFLPEKEFTINVETEPTKEEAEMARAKLMAKRYEIIQPQAIESTAQLSE